MTDNELISKIQHSPEYKMDDYYLVQLIERFLAQKAKLYEAEQIIDAEDTHA